MGLLVGDEDTWSLVVSRRWRVDLLGKEGKRDGEVGWREWWLTVAIVEVVGGDRRGVLVMFVDVTILECCVIRL